MYTKANFIEIPVNISDECWTRLNKCGLANAVLDENGNRNKFKCSLEYFHPKRWIPAVVPGEKPISPFEPKTFCCCRSMQNCQHLNQAGGCCKYCCKYLVKVDKQNNVTISTNKDKRGTVATHSTYLHNTKITSSDIQKKYRKQREEMWITQKPHVLHY